jgi:hypothetical protein
MKNKAVVCLAATLAAALHSFAQPALPTANQVAWADLEHGQFVHPNHPQDILGMAYASFDRGKYADVALSQGPATSSSWPSTRMDSVGGKR